jgi:hypothetical protein
MKQGYLSQYFAGVGAKRLSAVEADRARSNQHEFNAHKTLKTLLGEVDKGEKRRFPATLLYLSDNEDEPVIDQAQLTWYANYRLTSKKPRTPEYRLYFPGNRMNDLAAKGDLLLIARKQDGTLITIIAEQGSTIERQLLWLFGLSDLTHPGFSVRSELETEQDRVGFATRIILEQLGIEPEDEAPNYLEEMLHRFGGDFPKTLEFSAYARQTIKDVHAADDPDAALIAWMEREEVLFRTFEKHLLGDRLQQLCSETDTDAFLKLSLSVQNRRKSRAGSALENHLEQVFLDNGITYSRTAITENNLKPDFIFPSIAQYREPLFPSSRLTMLGAKTTCKDRWRQVINEAARIPVKHLLTLEPGISENQTAEMKQEKVQLVVPLMLHETYSVGQRSWILNLKDFTGLVRERQTA